MPEYYRAETIRLRENVDLLIRYCERKKAEYGADGSPWAQSAAAIYDEIVRKLTIVECCETNKIKEALE